MSVRSAPIALAEVLARGDVWRGDALAALPGTTIPSGYADLDDELPGAGWPRGQLTEILVDRGSVGEMSLLLPALARLSGAGGWLALVAPPWQPHAPAWAAAGVAPERLVVVRAGKEIAWCVEQLLACGGFAGVLAWPDAIDPRALRRLQVAAEGRAVFAGLWRPSAAADTPSPATLRIALTAGVPASGRVAAEAGGGLAPAAPSGPLSSLSLRILKRRGRPASRPLVLSVPRPVPALGRTSRAVAGPILSVVADRGLAAAQLA